MVSLVKRAVHYLPLSRTKIIFYVTIFYTLFMEMLLFFAMVFIDLVIRDLPTNWRGLSKPVYIHLAIAKGLVEYLDRVKCFPCTA